MLTVNEFNPLENKLITSPSENRNQVLFNIFCLWTFVILCRPQDVLPVLKLVRPALVTGILTLGAVALHYREISGPSFYQERQVKYYMTMVLVMILGIPFSLYARYSFMTIFTDYINVIMFFFIFYKVVDSVDKVTKVILIGCLGNGIYSIFSVFKGGIGGGRLAFGSMFDPNDLAFFAVGFLPLNLIFLSRDNPLWIRLACFTSLGFGIVLILLTGSRGGVTALGFAVLLLLLTKTKTINLYMKTVFIFLGIIIVSVLPINTERLRTLLSLEEDYNAHSETGRVAIWKAGVGFMLANPLTGVGVQCFNKAMGMDRDLRGAESRKWQTAHNSLVQIGAETGIVGLSLFMLMSINVIRIFSNIKKLSTINNLVKIGEMGLIGFVGLFIAAFFLSQAYSFYWAFYVVISASVNQMLAREYAMTSTLGDKFNDK